MQERPRRRRSATVQNGKDGGTLVQAGADVPDVAAASLTPAGQIVAALRAAIASGAGADPLDGLGRQAVPVGDMFGAWDRECS